MCGGSSQPDATETAEQQYQYNLQAAEDFMKLNAIDQFSPFGSTTYQTDESGVPVSQTVELSPEVQSWLDNNFAISDSLGSATLNQLSYLPTDQFQLDDSITTQGTAANLFGCHHQSCKLLRYKRYRTSLLR